jgi:hypothetical protein
VGSALECYRVSPEWSKPCFSPEVGLTSATGGPWMQVYKSALSDVENLLTLSGRSCCMIPTFLS